GTWAGTRPSALPTYRSTNRSYVCRAPGFRRLTRLNSSSMSFWTGVAVRSSMYFFERPATNRQFTLSRFLRRWASSTITRTHVVRKDRTASHRPQDAQARPLLVRIPDDAPQGGPSEQAVEPVDEGDPMRLAIERPCPRPVPRGAEGASQQVGVRIVELQGKRGIGGTSGLADGEGHRGGIPSPATAGGAKTHATLIIVAARRVQMHASSANA